MEKILGKKNSEETAQGVKRKRGLRMAILKTTGEQIVREYRRSAEVKALTPISELRTPCLPAGRRTYKLPWYRAVNWDVAFNWFCWGLLIGCLLYFGIFVIAPYAGKHLFNPEVWLSSIGDA